MRPSSGLHFGGVVIFTICITNPDVKVAPDRRGLRLEQDQVLRSLDGRHLNSDGESPNYNRVLHHRFI